MFFFCSKEKRMKYKYWLWRDEDTDIMYGFKSRYDKKDYTLHCDVFPGPMDGEEYQLLCEVASIHHNDEICDIHSNDKTVEYLVCLGANDNLEGMVESMERAIATTHVTKEPLNIVPETAGTVWKDRNNFNAWYWSVASEYLKDGI